MSENRDADLAVQLVMLAAQLFPPLLALVGEWIKGVEPGESYLADQIRAKMPVGSASSLVRRELEEMSRAKEGTILPPPVEESKE